MDKQYTIRQIDLHPGFTAWDISFDQMPWPFAMRIHKMTTPDLSDPHDHPFGMQSYMLKGGYVEEIFYPNRDGTFQTEVVAREEGTSHYIPAKRIHRIVELLTPEVWTAVITGPGEGPWCQWHIDGNYIREGTRR